MKIKYLLTLIALLMTSLSHSNLSTDPDQPGDQWTTVFHTKEDVTFNCQFEVVETSLQHVELKPIATCNLLGEETIRLDKNLNGSSWTKYDGSFFLNQEYCEVEGGYDRHHGDGSFSLLFPADNCSYGNNDQFTRWFIRK